MCIVALKHFDKTGWVGIKNRDRNYKPLVHIKQSFRRDMERMYILDDKTKYTEGLNEYGVCILSASVTTKFDEKEGEKANEKTREETIFYSPDGKKIRTALFEKDVNSALNKLMELKFPGNTIIFDRDTAYLLESAFNKECKYVTKYRQIKPDEIIVRTNHGIFIPWSGYQPSDDEDNISRESSENRKEIAENSLQNIQDYRNMLDAISHAQDKNPQMNPLRIDTGRKLKTTGQLMLVPSELTLYYRPVFCNMKFNFDKLDNEKSKTYFQILTSRQLKQAFESETIIKKAIARF